MSVCVVGGGIIGVSTALELLKTEPRAKVKLVREAASPGTVSDVSAGFWRPIYLPDPRTELLRRWGQLTFDRMEELWKEDPLRFGATRATGYELMREKTEEDYWSDVVYGYRRLGVAERTRMGFPEFKDGIAYTTYQLEPSRWLPVAEAELRGLGVELEERRVESLAELVDYTAVANCSGLGARRLVGDQSVYPIRGQVIRAKAPLAKEFYIVGDDFYMLQNTDCVVLGGTHTANDWDTGVREADTAFILQGLAKHFPWVTQLEVLSVAAGLRPARPQIRLESEQMQVGDKRLAVVHNYGHGGSGITLHHGCAVDAAQLLKQHIHRPNAKL